MIYQTNMQDTLFPFKCAVMRGNQPFMKHCHQELEIIKILSGSIAVSDEQEEFLLQEGDIWIVPPFMSHDIGAGSDGCERLAILLDLKITENGLADHDEWLDLHRSLSRIDFFSGHWDPEVSRQVSALVDELYLEYLEKEKAWHLALKILTDRLILTALRRMPERSIQPQEKEILRLKNILEYIALHYDGAITLQGCADAAGFNSTYLSRYFKRHMGVTFQEYVKRLRIDRAKWLLMTEDLPITEICYQSGFRDIKTFDKLFRQECGRTPTGFRKDSRQTSAAGESPCRSSG